MMENFYISLILPDSSSKTSDFIKSRIETIKDLMDYISTKYEINSTFTLNINDCILPLDESIKIINRSDIIKVKIKSVKSLSFAPGMRIKLNFTEFLPHISTGYILIPPNIKTVEKLLSRIAALYFINEEFVLYAPWGEVKNLSEFHNEMEVFLTPISTY